MPYKKNILIVATVPEIAEDIVLDKSIYDIFHGNLQSVNAIQFSSKGTPLFHSVLCLLQSANKKSSSF